MTTFRCFLVLQALLLWQGGFLFYAAVVVPIGTDVLGSFNQGRVTREVTQAMNIIGVVALALFAFDQWRSSARSRWWTWAVMVILLAGLWWLHPRIEAEIDFDAGYITDYARFYFWHRVYLYVASALWLGGLCYAWQWTAETRRD